MQLAGEQRKNTKNITRPKACRVRRAKRKRRSIQSTLSAKEQKRIMSSALNKRTARLAVFVLRDVQQAEENEKMTNKKSKPKYKVGAVVAVPLPDGRFAFAKVFRDTDLGVYDFVSKKIEPLRDVIGHKI